MNQYIVVTGGTRGIGRGISIKLAEKGFHVLALYARNRKPAEDLEAFSKKKGLHITTLRGDLTKESAFKDVVSQIREKTSHLYGIVHSAASGVHRSTMDLSLKHLRFTFEINVFSIHNLITELQNMLQEGSRLLAVTSSGGTRVIPYYAAVGSSKGALESLFRHYAQDLAKRKISVNLICPGLVLTEAIDAFVDKQQRIDTCKEMTPSGRITTVEDVSELVGFIMTNKCMEQIQGQTFVIDGGKTLLS